LDGKEAAVVATQGKGGTKEGAHIENDFWRGVRKYSFVICVENGFRIWFYFVNYFRCVVATKLLIFMSVIRLLLFVCKLSLFAFVIMLNKVGYIFLFIEHDNRFNA
jgi:hypothetical protein